MADVPPRRPASSTSTSAPASAASIAALAPAHAEADHHHVGLVVPGPDISGGEREDRFGRQLRHGVGP